MVCSASTTVLVESNTNLPTALAASNDILTCENNTVIISGSNSSAEGSLDYNWLNANQTVIGTGQDIEVSNVGIFTLIVTDNENGCSDQTAIEITEDIETPIAQAVSNQSLNCNLTEIILDATASSTGTSINYLWTTTDGNIVGDNDIQNPAIDAPGTYTLLVTNISNGCSASTDVEVEQTGLPILEIVSISEVSCFGGLNGSAILNTSGGEAPYTYQWPDGAEGPEQNNLSAGSYTISATDAFGCEDLIEINISQPEDILIQNRRSQQ